MGTVTDYLSSIIAKQVDDHGLVVWYDPDGHYQSFAAHLSIPDATVLRYEGSFFALRHAIEPFIAGFEPPRLVVYVPLDQAQTHHALLEAEAAGVVMQPGQQPPIRNMRLSIIARNALKPLLNSDAIAAIEKQVEAGQLSLADLDTLADKGEGISTGVIALIFGSEHAQDVALAFLSSDHYDAEIVTKDTGAALAALLTRAFDVTLPAGESPAAYRVRLARHILTTDLSVALAGDLPPSLLSVSMAQQPAARDACSTLAQVWRLRHDLRESYVAHATKVAQELGLAGMSFATEQIVAVETFLEIEHLLQHHIETALLHQATDYLVDLARQRQSGFWAEQLPDVQACWALIIAAGQVLREADRVEQALTAPALDATAMLHAYATAEHPWCLLDTTHRNMERRYHTFDFAAAGQQQALEQLVFKARDRYTQVGSALAEAFVRCYQQAAFHLPTVLRQVEIFDQYVRPALAQGKTAYIWVDALRYEMARELAQTLGAERDIKLTPALAAVPTITAIGMAALLPGAQHATLVSAGKQRLALDINGTIIKERKDRIAFLKAGIDGTVVDARLNELMPSPKKKIRDAIQQADLILLTSQEIDQLCEGDDIHLARRTMDDMLSELSRAFRILTDLHVQTIIVAADHGYLFGDELSDSMKIDVPGGDTAEVKRRVWVGRGGAAQASYVRAKIADFGLGSDLEIASPVGFAGFKVKGGAKAYFHGGLAPQEVIIPVLTLTAKPDQGMAHDPITWSLTPGSQKISTRFISVHIAGERAQAQMFDVVPPRVRVEIRVKNTVISIPTSASYGFEEATSEVQLALKDADPLTIEPNTVALMIANPPEEKTTASIHLIDAATGVELARLKRIEVAILAY